MRILGIDPSSEVMQKAEQFRKRFVEEEEEMMKKDSDIEEEDPPGPGGLGNQTQVSSSRLLIHP